MRPSALLATFAMAALLPGFRFALNSPWGISSRAVNRILEQGTWGPTPTLPATLQEDSLEAWFAEQVNAPIPTYPDQPMLTSDGKKNNRPPTKVMMLPGGRGCKDQRVSGRAG